LFYELFVLDNLEHKNKYPYIRDKDDVAVLISTIEADVDILVTGDKDFDDVKLARPKILKARQFFEEYIE